MASALELFWFDLDGPLAPAGLASLCPAERARAARYLTPRHGQHFIAARAMLRELLAQRLGCAAADVAFEFGVNGKPRLAAGGLRFNLSHSGHYGLIGLHAENELGVDLEIERPTRDDIGLARRFFTARESAWLEALPAVARAHGFCRLWTCKEAWMKADGSGLALPLDQVETIFTAAGPRLRAVAPPFRDWWVRELDLLSGYAAAVVMSEAPAAVTVRRLPPGPSIALESTRSER